ncbi:MAG: hypothetical protein GY869_32785, partial [Planctomycetes bacterium]|nr:hypothetical protein [Planctomycetota bacterium]
MKPFENKLLVLVWLMILFAPVWGQAPAVEQQVVRTSQEVRLVDKPGELVVVLGNGMTAIVKENHTAPV